MKWRAQYLFAMRWVLGTNYGYGEVLEEDALMRGRRVKVRESLDEACHTMSEIRTRLGLWCRFRKNPMGFRASNLVVGGYDYPRRSGRLVDDSSHA